MTQKWFNVALAIVAAAALIIGFVALSEAETRYQAMALPGDVSNFSGVHVAAPTAMASATPGLMVDAYGVNLPFEVRKAATPVAYIDGSGNLDAEGTANFASAITIQSGGIDVQAGSITLANDETIGNATDTVIDISAFFAFTEQTVIALSADGTITPTGSYQPITSTAAVTTSTSTAIANGAKVGSLLVICNENASDAIIIDDGANTNLGGNKTLTGGEGDCIWLIWDGSDWNCIGYNDN